MTDTAVLFRASYQRGIVASAGIAMGIGDGEGQGHVLFPPNFLKKHFRANIMKNMGIF